MNISKALKVKNRLLGEFNSLKGILHRENSRILCSSEITRSEVEARMLEKLDELMKMRAAINVASAAIASQLIKLSELKSLHGFYSALNTRDGEEIITARYGNTEPTKQIWDAHINRDRLDKKLQEMQEQINALQDEVDEFNARTTVTI